MASNPPSKCCTEATQKIGISTGSYAEQYGLNTYVSGEKSKKVVVIFTDIFGYKFSNNTLIADRFAQAGYYTLIPDLFHDDAFKVDSSFETDFYPWLANHSPADIFPLVGSFLAQLKADVEFEFLGVVGHCFGSIFALPQVAEGQLATCAAVAHPSGVSIETVDAIKKPVLISAAEEDEVFPLELRQLTEAKLKENKTTYQIDLFSGTSHGYAVRGDESVPSIKYAKEKTLRDQIYWFDNFSQA